MIESLNFLDKTTNTSFCSSRFWQCWKTTCSHSKKKKKRNTGNGWV